MREFRKSGVCGFFIGNRTREWERLNLLRNNIGDEGCYHLAQTKFPKLSNINLCNIL
jgi:hypothetical protein